MISYVGFPRKEELLRLNIFTMFFFPNVNFTMFFFPTFTPLSLGRAFRSETPLRIFFFFVSLTWTTSLGKIFPSDNLHKRIILIDWCCMRNKSGKIPNLLLHCDVERDLWNIVFQTFRVEWFMPRQAVDFMACWKRRFGRNDIDIV